MADDRKSKAGEGERPFPRHIAVILDGNGRWAQRRGLPRSLGHKAGAETFRRIAYACRDRGLDYLTVYAFSTENWKRSADEVGALMRLLGDYLREAIEKMENEGIRMRVFGETSALSPELRALVARTYEISGHEIRRAARRYAADYAAGRAGELDEALFASYLDSAGIPDPDLLIRPGGEQRISNFLLWQCAYSEFYFTDVLWPDFTPEELDKAIAVYRTRDRRFGGVKA